MAAKTIPGYFSKLNHILETTDRTLPVEDNQSLFNRLSADGDWTTLLIQDTVGYEVVKVVNHRGTLGIDRGLSGTMSKRFPIGSCVVFSPSDELLKAMACETDCCENGVDSNFGTATTAPNTVPVERVPTSVVGGVNAVLGEPAGFMLINGKKVPYYD